MTETFEYGYVNLLDVTALTQTAPATRQWVGVIQTGAGTTVEGTGESALTILNRLGQDSWVISDGRGEPVKDNDVPDWLVLVLRQTFGRLGMIHTRQSRWMYRRVVWNATHRIDGGLSSDRLSSRAPK